MPDTGEDLNLDKTYIRRRLRVSCREEQNRSDSITQRYINIRGLSSQDAENYILESEQGLKAKFIRLAFRNKDFIKRIPFIGGKMLSLKNNMLKKSIVKLNTCTFDVSPYLEWYKTDFISAIYELLLGREVDENGLNSYLNLMRQGASKGAIVYLIAISDEFGAKGEITYLKQYKKEYKRFIFKQRVTKLPVLGKVSSVFTLKSQISELYDRIERTEVIAEINAQRVLSTYNQLLSSMQSSNENNIKVINNMIQDQVDNLENKFSKNTSDIKACFEESTVELKENINANANIISSSITNIGDSMELVQKIDTSISQKLDVLPTYISQVGAKNKSVVTSIAGGITAVIVDDFIMGIPSEEWGLAMFLSLNGHFEPGTEKFFESIIKPGMSVVDIGANLGIFTLRALRGGCKVYAYEPTPSTYSILNQNIKANGYWESGRWNTFNLGAFNKHEFTEFLLRKKCVDKTRFLNKPQIHRKFKLKWLS